MTKEEFKSKHYFTDNDLKILKSFDKENYEAIDKITSTKWLRYHNLTRQQLQDIVYNIYWYNT